MKHMRALDTERDYREESRTMDQPDSGKVDVGTLRIFREPAWMLRLTIDADRSYPWVKIVRAAPLSHPNQYISFLDSEDEEICMIDSLEELDEATRALVKEELDRRYITSTVVRVNAVRNEFGTSYWDVDTDRGRREFVVQNVAENARWLGANRLLLIDVDGNRFELPQLDTLDKKSLRRVQQVL